MLKSIKIIKKYFYIYKIMFICNETFFRLHFREAIIKQRSNS